MSWRRKSCRHNKRQPVEGGKRKLLLRDLIHSNGEKGNESFALDLKTVFEISSKKAHFIQHQKCAHIWALVASGRKKKCSLILSPRRDFFSGSCPTVCYCARRRKGGEESGPLSYSHTNKLSRSMLEVCNSLADVAPALDPLLGAE